MKIAIIILFCAILSDISDSKKVYDFMFIQDTLTRMGMMIMEKTPFLQFTNKHQLPLLHNDVSATDTAQWMKIAADIENNPKNNNELLKKWCSFVKTILPLVNKWREGNPIERQEIHTYWEQNSLMVKAIEDKADVDFPKPYNEQTFNTTYLEYGLEMQYINSISKHHKNQFIETDVAPDDRPGGLGAPPGPPGGTGGAGGSGGSGGAGPSGPSKPDEPGNGGGSPSRRSHHHHPSDPSKDKGKAPMDTTQLGRSRSPAKESRGGIQIKEGGVTTKETKKSSPQKIRHSTSPSKTAAAAAAAPEAGAGIRDTKETASPSKSKASATAKVEEASHTAKTSTTSKKPRSSSVPKTRSEASPSKTASEAGGSHRSGSPTSTKKKDAKEGSPTKSRASASGKVEEGSTMKKPRSSSVSKTRSGETTDRPHKRPNTVRSATPPSHRPPKAAVASQA